MQPFKDPGALFDASSIYVFCWFTSSATRCLRAQKRLLLFLAPAGAQYVRTLYVIYTLFLSWCHIPPHTKKITTYLTKGLPTNFFFLQHSSKEGGGQTHVQFFFCKFWHQIYIKLTSKFFLRVELSRFLAIFDIVSKDLCLFLSRKKRRSHTF